MGSRPRLYRLLAVGGVLAVLPWGLGAEETASDHLQTGLEALRRGDSAGTAAGFQQALRLDSHLAEAHARLGQVWADQGQEYDAARHYEQFLLDADPGQSLHRALVQSIGPWLAHYYQTHGEADREQQVLQRLAVLEPEQVAYRSRLGELLQEAGQPAQAAEQYEAILRITDQPETWEVALTRWVEALIEAVRVEETLQKFEGTWAQHQAEPWQAASLFRLYLAAGRADEAAQLFSRVAAEIDPAQQETFFARLHGVALASAPAERLQSVYEHLFADATGAAAHLRLADLYERLHQSERALAELERAQALAPEEGAILIRLAETYRQAGLLDQAWEAYATLVEREPGNAEARWGLAATWAARGEAAAAYAACPDLTTFCPHLSPGSEPGVNPLRPLWAAIQKIHALGLIEQALADYEQRAAAAPEEAFLPAVVGLLAAVSAWPERGVEPLVRAFTRRGPVSVWWEGDLLRPWLEAQDRADLWGELLASMVLSSAGPRMARLNLLPALLEAWGQAGEAEAGLARVRQAAEQAPHDPILWRLVAHLEEAGRRPERAVEAWQRAAEAEPNSARGWAGLAQAYGRLGQWEPAQRVWQRAVGLEPWNSSLQVGLAETLAQRGRFTEAAEAYERAVELAPPASRPAGARGTDRGPPEPARADPGEPRAAAGRGGSTSGGLSPTAGPGRRFPSSAAAGGGGSSVSPGGRPGPQRRGGTRGAVSALGRAGAARPRSPGWVRLVPLCPSEMPVLDHFSALLAAGPFDREMAAEFLAAMEGAGADRSGKSRWPGLKPLFHASAGRAEEALQSFLALPARGWWTSLKPQLRSLLFSALARSGAQADAEAVLSRWASPEEAPTDTLRLYAEFLDFLYQSAAALAQYRRLFSRQPDSSSDLHSLARLAEWQGDEAEALAARQKLAAAEPQSALRQAALAAAYERFGHREKAVAAYRQAAVLAPHRAERGRYEAEVARLETANQDFEQAQATLEQRLAQDPKNPRLHELLGDAYLRHGEAEKALAEYLTADALPGGRENGPVVYRKLRQWQESGPFQASVALYHAMIDRGLVDRVEATFLLGAAAEPSRDETIARFVASREALLAGPSREAAQQARLALAEMYETMARGS